LFIDLVPHSGNFHTGKRAECPVSKFHYLVQDLWDTADSCWWYRV